MFPNPTENTEFFPRAAICVEHARARVLFGQKHASRAGRLFPPELTALWNAKRVPGRASSNARTAARTRQILPSAASCVDRQAASASPPRRDAQNLSGETKRREFSRRSPYESDCRYGLDAPPAHGEPEKPIDLCAFPATLSQ